MLLVIPFFKENTTQAEALIDWIYQLAGRKAHGSALLVASNDVHPEIREKLKVSAELAFEFSEMIQLEKFEGVKPECINHAFNSASAYIARNYKTPFFWMEPDTTPIKAGWYDALKSAYDAQPKRYAGSFLKSGENLFTARAICYPVNASTDLQAFCTGSKSTYNVSAGVNLTARATKNYVVAELPIRDEADCSKILPAAMVVHGDKAQILLNKIKAEQK